jgi:hypothetical protein
VSFGTPRRPRAACTTPATIVAGSRYSTPWSRTRSTTTSAIAPVAAEIIAGRPPTKAIVTAMVKEAAATRDGAGLEAAAASHKLNPTLT